MNGILTVRNVNILMDATVLGLHFDLLRRERDGMSWRFHQHESIGIFTIKSLALVSFISIFNFSTSAWSRFSPVTFGLYHFVTLTLSSPSTST